MPIMNSELIFIVHGNVACSLPGIRQLKGPYSILLTAGECQLDIHR